MIYISYILVGITIITSIIGFTNHKLRDKWIFNPYSVQKYRQYYRFLTSAFLHADFFHLAMNMYVLFSFGPYIEKYFQVTYANNMLYVTLAFLGLYIPGAILSCFYSYEKQKNNMYYNALGASGAISGVVFAFIAISPISKMIIFPVPIPMPAFVLGVLYLLFSWIMARRKMDNIGHDAHFFGALYGLMFMFIIQPHLFKEFFQTIQYYFQHML